MNKILGQLMTILYAPADDAPNGGGAGSKAGPAEDFYAPSKGTNIPTREEEVEDGPEKDAADETEDFSDETENEEGEDEGDFTDGETEEGEEGEETEQPEKETKEEKYLRIAPEDLAKLAPREQKQTEQEKPLTQEQIRALVNPVEVTDELVAQMGHEDPKVRAKALQGFANATVKNAYSLAKLLIDKKTKEFEAAIGPLMQQSRQVAAQTTRQSFFSTYKDLAKYDEIVKLASHEVEPIDANGNEKSQKQIFQEVAVLTRKKLAALGVKVQQPNANHSAGGGKPVPQANRLSSSGRSGGDQHSGKGKPNNADADIYAR